MKPIPPMSFFRHLANCKATKLGAGNPAPCFANGTAYSSMGCSPAEPISASADKSKVAPSRRTPFFIVKSYLPLRNQFDVQSTLNISFTGTDYWGKLNSSII